MTRIVVDGMVFKIKLTDDFKVFCFKAFPAKDATSDQMKSWQAKQTGGVCVVDPYTFWNQHGNLKVLAGSVTLGRYAEVIDAIEYHLKATKEER